MGLTDAGFVRHWLFFFSSRRRHTRCSRDWSSDVCSSDLFRGQDVLVFDFEPNPEFQPHKLEERVVQKLAGVVWVDEKAHDVARLEAYFVGDVKIGRASCRERV